MIEYRLANTLGLDTGNAQHSIAITEALHGIEDTDAFLEFCVDKKDAIGFSTKPEKLMTLSSRYKKLQDDAKLPNDLAVSFSRVLSHKVSDARLFIKNEIAEGKSGVFTALKADGYQYFTEKELTALTALGSAMYIIELCEQSRLDEELVKLFLSRYIKRSKYQALTDGQKEVKALMSKGIK